VIVSFTKQAVGHLNELKKSGNKQVVKKIKELLESIVLDPYSGVGQPEPLKHNLSGAWSRRINKEHRLVYKVEEETVYIIGLKGHY
jgi:toxin YoeB